MACIDRSQYDPEILRRASTVRMLVLDVDGVLTDGRLYFDNQGNETKAFCTRDGLGLKALQSQGIELALITGRSSRIVADRAQQLGIRHVYQGSDNKRSAFADLLANTGMNAESVCYAGDDWIDLPVLEQAGFAVSVSNADEVVKSRVHWVTKRAGGDNAVREICDLILAAQDLDEAVMKSIMETS